MLSKNIIHECSKWCIIRILTLMVYWLTILSIRGNSFNAPTCIVCITVTFPVGGALVTRPKVVILTMALEPSAFIAANFQKNLKFYCHYEISGIVIIVPSKGLKIWITCSDISFWDVYLCSNWGREIDSFQYVSQLICICRVHLNQYLVFINNRRFGWKTSVIRNNIISGDTNIYNILNFWFKLEQLYASKPQRGCNFYTSPFRHV